MRSSLPLKRRATWLQWVRSYIGSFRNAFFAWFALLQLVTSPIGHGWSQWSWGCDYILVSHDDFTLLGAHIDPTPPTATTLHRTVYTKYLSLHLCSLFFMTPKWPFLFFAAVGLSWGCRICCALPHPLSSLRQLVRLTVRSLRTLLAALSQRGLGSRPPHLQCSMGGLNSLPTIWRHMAQYGMPAYPVSLAYNFFIFYNTAFNFSQCIKRSRSQY